MAFKKVNPTSVADMLQQLVTFLSTECSWQNCAVNSKNWTFQSSSKLPVFTLTHTTDTAFSTTHNQVLINSSVNTNLNQSSCSNIVGITNVWFKGTDKECMIVMETTPNNFKWFGFGSSVAIDGDYFHWTVGSYSNYSKSSIANKHLGYDGVELFGVNPFTLRNNNSYGYGSQVVYKNTIYGGTTNTVNSLSGGVGSFQWVEACIAGINYHTGQRLFHKTYLCGTTSTSTQIIIGEIPLIYTADTLGFTGTKEFEFGNRRFMVFPFGYYSSDAGSTYTGTSSDWNNATWADRNRCGYEGFALEIS